MLDWRLTLYLKDEPVALFNLHQYKGVTVFSRLFSNFSEPDFLFGHREMISSKKFLRNFSIIKFEFILLGYKSHFPRLCTQFQIRVQNNNYFRSSLRFSSFFCWNFFEFFASCAQGIISSEISFISTIISGSSHHDAHISTTILVSNRHAA